MQQTYAVESMCAVDVERSRCMKQNVCMQQMNKEADVCSRMYVCSRCMQQKIVGAYAVAYAAKK
jgi:hypothetical protein